MDFFKPDFKHSDPRVRQKSIERITDLNIIAEVLQSDEDSNVRQTCLSSLDTIPKMKEVLSKLSGDVQAILDKQLHKAYFDSALKATSVDDAYLSELNDHQLSRVARESKDETIQEAAAARISDEKELSSVISNGSKKAAQVALEKINDREKLLKLEKSAKSKGVKNLVRKHYDHLFGEADRAEERRQAGLIKLEKIVKLLEGMSTLDDWSKLEDDYQVQQNRWQENVEFADEGLNARYKEACENCIQKRDEFRVKEEARLAKEKAVNERMEKRRSILQSINEAVEVIQEDEVDTLASFESQWAGIGEAEDQIEKEIDTKFKKAMSSFSSKQSVLKDLESKKESIKAGIEEVATSVTSLLDSQDFYEVTKQSKSLKSKLVSFSKNLPKDFTELYESTEAKLGELTEKIAKLKSEEEAKLKEVRDQYDAIIREVDQMEAQSKEKTERVKELQANFKALAKLPGKELDKLTQKFRKSCDAYFAKVKEAIEEREWNQFGNLTAKEKLIADLAALDSIEDPVELAKQIKEKQATWKTIGPVPAEKADEIWDRFKKTGDALYERCKEYYAEQDEVRQKNASAKEELCVKAEEHSASTDWKETAEALKGLQASWKEIGPAPRKQDKELWERFRAACDKFFNARKERFAAMDSNRVENTAKKQALVEEIEKALEMENARSASERIKELQKQWKEVGPAERDKEKELWTRFREVADQFFNRRRENFEQQQAFMEENAKSKVEMIAMLKEKLADLGDDADWTSLAQVFKQSQKSFRELPGAGFERDKQLKQELKETCDKFFTARNEHFDQLSNEDKENLSVKEEFCLKVELLAESSEWRDTAEELKSLQAEFKDLPSVNEKYDPIMYKRFNDICQTFFDRRREHFEEQDEKRQENLKKKKDLCIQLEKLAGVEYSSESDFSSVQDMAAQLQNAFDNNFGGHEETASPKSFKEASQEVRELQAAWKTIGPAPKAQSQEIWERFRTAADSFYEKRNEFFAGQKSTYAENLKKKQAILAELKSQKASGTPDFRKVKSLQKDWRAAGDVAREESRSINSEFKEVCDAIYQSSKQDVEVEEEQEVRI